MNKKSALELLQILAENIRNQRTKLGLSQEKLAEACNLHRTYIGAIERCERNVTITTLAKLAAALGVSVPFLLTRQEASEYSSHSDGQQFISNIRESRYTIYDPIQVDDSKLWIPTETLEKLLQVNLYGMDLGNLPLRTRSKVMKEAVCKALGYPIPKTFKKTQPRFPGQNFDSYIQKSNNLQIWNEAVSPNRRYVLIRISTDNLVESVKVVTGDVIAKFDKTGTLTQKYQARLEVSANPCELVSSKDTDNLDKLIMKGIFPADFDNSPLDEPTVELLPISEIFTRLSMLVEERFEDAGRDQERNRGSLLHKRVCEILGYHEYKDDGTFPDIRHQLLEVKLQISPTIDLGLVLPNSTDALPFQTQGQSVRFCDVRYAIFAAKLTVEGFELTHLILTTGEDFFGRFKQFKGKVSNKKLQIPLPSNFFDR